MNIAFSSLLAKYSNEILTLASKLEIKRVEWDLNFIPIPANQGRLFRLAETMMESGLQVRFHFPYSTYDLLAQNQRIRRITLDFFLFLLELAKPFQTDLVVVHLAHMDGNAAVRNESAFAEFRQFCKKASEVGVNVAVENLLYGVTSDLNTLLEICHKGGAKLCFDIGHFRGALKDNEEHMIEQIQMVESAVNQIHVYGKEVDLVHHPLICIDHVIQEFIQKFARTKEIWWTIEVDNLISFQSSLKILGC